MEIETEDLDLKHPHSGRAVPVRRYRALDEPVAAVILSVGYGGDRGGYAYLARSWASFGITTFVVEHVGSNLDVLRSLPQETMSERHTEVVKRVLDPEELQARPADLALAWQSVKQECKDLPLGLCGHSYGSYAVLAAVGLNPRQVKHGVEPLPARSLLVISPQPPGMLFEESEYQSVAAPTLVLTGTEDYLLDGSAGYQGRLKVFECLPSFRRHLIVLKGVEHMTFAGVGLKLGPHLHLIKKLTSLWWNESLVQSGPTELWKDLVFSTVDPKEVAECR